MIQELNIKNVALIRELSLSLNPGMNVLSGETGAGKSIIVDAVNLILGRRGDKELIQYGAEKAQVQAQILLPADRLEDAKAQYQAEDDILVVSRELFQTGRNICRINGNLVSLGELRTLMASLVNLHGQNQHQQILEEKNHLSILDQSLEAKLAEKKRELEMQFSRYRQAKEELEALKAGQQEKERTLDMLRFQIEELERAAIQPGEEERLRQEKQLQENAESIAKHLDMAKEAVSGSQGAVDSLYRAARELEEISALDARYARTLEALKEAYYTVEEASFDMASYAEEATCDPERLEQLEDRLYELSRLERKYGASEEDMLRYLEEAKSRRDLLENSETAIHDREEALKKLKMDLEETAQVVSDLRQAGAKELEREVVQQLRELGMPNASFEIRFTKGELKKNGWDVVSFWMTVNKGEPAKPLAKVASGGEASRIMLALKSITALRDEADTLIFDEVDAGISGKMAHVVAEKMANLAKSRQVICVTHLPQIAAMADAHFIITKQECAGRTETQVSLLSGDALLEEIARLSGGTRTTAALAHAQELVDKALDFKKKRK